MKGAVVDAAAAAVVGGAVAVAATVELAVFADWYHHQTQGDVPDSAAAFELLLAGQESKVVGRLVGIQYSRFPCFECPQHPEPTCFCSAMTQSWSSLVSFPPSLAC